MGAAGANFVAVRRITIALDGYAGCGKSTTAKAVARSLHYLFLDSGAMYRAFTLHLMQQGISVTDIAAVEAALPQAHIELQLGADPEQRHVLLNGENVDVEIRMPEVSGLVSEVSAIAAVRHLMVAQQRRIGAQKGVVMDGRDIGTVVFPDAELKVFMSASIEARVLRRQGELERIGQHVDLAELRANLEKRDHIDSTRTEGPLRQAPDARVLDTTALTIGQQVEIVLDWARELISAPVSLVRDETIVAR